MYCIADWDTNFEVDSNGRRWKPGAQYFAGPLPYVRCPARRDWPVKLLHIERQLGEQVYMILGIFEKLASIVATEPRPLREGGVIRNSRQEPATLSDIAIMLLLDEERAKWALDVLCGPSVEWVLRGGEGALPGDAEERPEAQRASLKTAALADNSEPRCNPQNSQISLKTASCHSHVMSYQNSSKSCNTINTREGSPRILPIHDETDQNGHDHDPRPDSRCFVYLTTRLNPIDNNSYNALANFVQWLSQDADQKRAGPGRYEKAASIASDCVKAESPVACFMARAKKEWGYTPPSRKQRTR